MKRLVKSLGLLLFVSSLMVPVTFAQHHLANDDDEVVARTIRQRVREGKTDGMEVTLYEIQGEKEIPILDTGRTFKNKDALRVEFTSSVEGFVYFINISPDGQKAVIYPDAEVPNQANTVMKGRTYRLPDAQTSFFNFEGDTKGDEIIQVIMSRKRIPFFDDAVRNSRGELGQTSADAAAEL